MDIGNQYVMKNETYTNKINYVDDFVLDKQLKEYICNWHSKQNDSIKEKNKQFLKNTVVNQNLKFESIIKRLKEQYE